MVLVGEHPPSAAYVRSKVKATLEAGMESFEHRLPASVSQDELIALIDQLNADPAVDGILVQLPLPDQVDERVIITRISPDKDVDGFHPVNAGRLAIGLHGFVPCTPLGCLMLLRSRSSATSAGLDADRRRPLEHRRQADGAASASGELHRDDRPFENARSAGRGSAARTSSLQPSGDRS